MGEACETLMVREARGFVFLYLETLFLGNVSFHDYEGVIAEQDG